MLPPLTENEDLNSFLYRLQEGVTDAISLSVVPASPEANGYLYRFLFIKYANDNIGTGFGDSPVGKTYYGLCNRDTPTESTNPTDYTWYAAVFGVSNNLYYKNIGGRKLQFDVNTAPIDYKWLLDNSLAIDLDNIVPARTVTTVEILDAAVTELKLAAAAVTANKTNIAAISSLTGELNSNTVTSLQIATDAVINTKLAAAAVTANKTNIAAINAASGNLNSGTVNTAQIVANAVTNLEIAANAVTANKTSIAAINAITGNLNSNTVDAAQLVANAVASTAIAAGAVTANKTTIAAINPASGNLTANSVTAGAIAAGTIVANDIAAGTITGAKIAAGTIAAANIAAGTITSAEIAAGTIVASDIAAGTITGAQIAAGTIAAGNIVAGTITSAEIAAGTIVASDIAAGTITGANIAANTIAAGNIVASTITATELATDSVISSKIQAGAVTAAKITVTDLAAINANMGNITAGSLTIAGVGGAPTITGTTMTGSGALIKTNGTFALGDSTRNIVNNGSTVSLNGFYTPTFSYTTPGVLVAPSGTYTLLSSLSYTIAKPLVVDVYVNLRMGLTDVNSNLYIGVEFSTAAYVYDTTAGATVISSGQYQNSGAFQQTKTGVSLWYYNYSAQNVYKMMFTPVVGHTYEIRFLNLSSKRTDIAGTAAWQDIFLNTGDLYIQQIAV